MGLMIGRNNVLLSQLLTCEGYFLGTLFHAHFLPLRSLQFTAEFSVVNVKAATIRRLTN